MEILQGIVLAASFIIILLISFVGNHIDKINREVVDVYRMVRLWDVAELSTKCSDFLTAKGCKVTKRRNSSLLRIFPVRTFLQIIADASNGSRKEKKNALEESRSVAVKSQLREEASIRDAMSPDPLFTPALLTPAENAGSPAVQMDNE